MHKKILIVLAFLLVNTAIYSQSKFQKIFEKDLTIAYSGQQTSDGGYIMAGLHQVSATDFDYLVVKTNSAGDTLWTKTYGGIGDEECYAMQQTTDGGYIFAGIDSSSGLGNYNVYLVKTNATGDTLWTRSYGGSGHDFGQAVQQTADGGYIIAGYTNSYSANGYDDVYLLKTDANGNLTWSKTYGGIYTDDAFAVKQTADGGYILAGLTSSFGISPYGNVNDLYVFKTDANGGLIWSKTYGQNGDDWAYSVIQTPDGGYAITGHTNTDSTASHSDLYLIKTDANGDTLFTKSFGGPDYEKGLAIIGTNDGGLAIGGSTYSFGHGSSDLYLLKTNASGSLIFNSTFGFYGNEFAYTISQTTDKGYILGGYSDASSSNFYMVKTDSLGKSDSCNQTTPTPTIVTGVAVVTTPATSVGTPTTTIARNTHTSVGYSGVSVLDACPQTTGIKQNESKQAAKFVIYPNPSNGNIYIATTNLKENTQLIIYNQLGQIILTKQINNELTNLNLDLSAGVYQVRILSGNELIYQTKIIKE
ncbi:MAG TPA: T9SS type A sorting domain-containing protein [Bacteroidia bacterium]|jgi:hypothetical protein|nr:T9SS type A sorting domain-containing protein [Bacteroidia bacterium]